MAHGAPVREIAATKDPHIGLPNKTTLAGTVVATALATLAPVTAASADHDVTPARISGEDRIDTAAEMAELQYDAGTADVVLARDDDYPDALAGAPLARALGAPILLTDPGELSERTDQALENLGAETVTILGGDAAVSQEVEDELESQGYTVDRIFGDTRYGTAANVAQRVQDSNDGGANFTGGVRAAFVATGQNFPDALSVGPLAANPNAPIPIVLTKQDELPMPSHETIERLNIENVFIIGGPGAISNDVAAELDDEDTSIQRVAGPNRAWTAAEVANFARYFMDFDAEEIVVSRGDFWSDALAAGPFAGATRDPILLSGSPDDEIPFASADWTEDGCADVGTVRAIGGTAAVTQAELEAFETTAENCHDTKDNAQDYIVAPQEAIELSAGESAELSAVERFDGGGEISQPLDVALFGCDDIAQVEGEGRPEFRDLDTDNLADGFASSDTGSARIVAVEGEATDRGHQYVRDLTDTNGDGEISVTISSDAADCTIPVFFHNENNISALNLDPSDDPFDDFGVGKVSWS